MNCKKIKGKTTYILMLAVFTGYLFNTFFISKVYAGMWTDYAPAGIAGYIDGSTVTTNVGNVTGAPDNKVATLAAGAVDDLTATGYSLNRPGNIINAITFSYVVAAQGDFAGMSPDTWELLFSPNSGVSWFSARAASAQQVPELTTFTYTAEVNPATGQPWMWTDIALLQLKMQRNVIGAADDILVVADSFYITVNYVDSDITPPRVVTVAPVDAATGVAVTASVDAVFSEPVNESTLNEATFTIHENVNNAAYNSIYRVEGVVAYDHQLNQAFFKPARPLKYNTSYIVNLTNGIQDPAGNSLTGYTWTFTTEEDRSPPSILGFTPADRSAANGIADIISVTFNEPMEPFAMNTANISVSETVYGEIYDHALSGQVTYNRHTNTVSFLPAANFSANSQVKVYVGTGVADISGNRLPAPVTWVFSTVEDFTYAPPAPASVVVRGLDATSVGISWQQVNTAVGYYVYRSSFPTGYFMPVGQTSRQGDTYYVDTGLLPNNTYFYQVAAFNNAGASPLSDNFPLTYTDWNGVAVTDYANKGITGIPNAPVGISVYNSDTQVDLNWHTVNNLSFGGYNVYRTETSGGPYSLMNPVPLDFMINTYVDTAVYNYQSYYYRVAAVDVNGVEGKKSAEIWARPEGKPFAAAPHLDGSKNTFVCAICHKNHTGFGELQIKATTVQKLCFTCHDGSASQKDLIREQINARTNHNIYPDIPGSLKCTGCHEPRLDYEEQKPDGSRRYAKLLMNNYEHTTNFRGNAVCYSCHGRDTTLKTGVVSSLFEAGIHKTVLPQPPSGTGIQCLNCHRPHVSANDRLLLHDRENLCFRCHNAEQFTASADSQASHDVRAEAQLATQAAITCSNCHNPHATTREAKLTDPDAPNKIWQGTVNSFCVKCHDGNFPGPEKTMPYAPGIIQSTTSLTNVAEKFYLRFDNKADMHGEGNPNPNKSIQDPVFGFGYATAQVQQGRTLECRNCHEQHGAGNVYHLKTTINSPDNLLTRPGMFIYNWNYLDGISKKTGADARFFCSGCHGQGHMGNRKQWPTNCFTAGCHRHGDKF